MWEYAVGCLVDDLGKAVSLLLASLAARAIFVSLFHLLLLRKVFFD